MPALSRRELEGGLQHLPADDLRPASGEEPQQWRRQPERGALEAVGELHAARHCPRNPRPAKPVGCRARAMRALVYENHLPRLVATKLLGSLSRRAFVGPLAPLRLRELPEPVDLVLLDGFKDLYLPVLKLVTPRLRRGALVLADNIFTFRRSLRPYVEYVQSGTNGFESTTLRISDGFELSVRVC